MLLSVQIVHGMGRPYSRGANRNSKTETGGGGNHVQEFQEKGKGEAMRTEQEIQEMQAAY